MKLFSFKRNNLKFYNLLKEIEREPYVMKYRKNGGVIIPVMLFKANSEVLMIFFRYWRKEPGKVIKRVVSEEIIIKLWKEERFSYYTPFREYLNEEEIAIIEILTEKLKKAEDEKLKKMLKSKLMSLLLKAGKRVGLHKIIIIKR